MRNHFRDVEKVAGDVLNFVPDPEKSQRPLFKNHVAWPIDGMQGSIRGMSQIKYLTISETRGDVKTYVPTEEAKDFVSRSPARAAPTVVENDKRSEVAGKISAMEGKRILELHLRPERDQGLIQRFKKSLSDFSCRACGFNFELVYGKLGKRFIEAHHRKPIGPRLE